MKQGGVSPGRKERVLRGGALLSPPPPVPPPPVPPPPVPPLSSPPRGAAQGRPPSPIRSVLHPFLHPVLHPFLHAFLHSFFHAFLHPGGIPPSRHSAAARVTPGVGGQRWVCWWWWWWGGRACAALAALPWLCCGGRRSGWLCGRVAVWSGGCLVGAVWLGPLGHDACAWSVSDGLGTRIGLRRIESSHSSSSLRSVAAAAAASSRGASHADCSRCSEWCFS